MKNENEVRAKMDELNHRLRQTTNKTEMIIVSARVETLEWILDMEERFK
jgi:hypothetical protein